MTSLWDKAQQGLSDMDKKYFGINGGTNQHQILQQIITLVEQQIQQNLQSRWKVKGRDGQEIFVRDVCAKMAVCIQQFVGVVDVVVQFDPIHSALPWAGIRLLLLMAVNDAQTFNAIIEALEKVSNVVARYALVEKLYLSAPGTSAAQDALEEEIVKLYEAVLRFLCKARKYYQRGPAKRTIMSTIHRNEPEIALQDIEDKDIKINRLADIIRGEKRESGFDSKFAEESRKQIAELRTSINTRRKPGVYT